MLVEIVGGEICGSLKQAGLLHSSTLCRKTFMGDLYLHPG
jgi:hypothetical protein